MNYKRYYIFLNTLSVLAKNLAKSEKVKAINRISKYDSIYDDDFVEDIEIIQNYALVELVHYNIFIACSNYLKVEERIKNVTLEVSLDMLMSVMDKMKHYDVIYSHNNERINYILYVLFTMSEILQQLVYKNRDIYGWEAVINTRIKNIIGGEQYDEIIESCSN